MAEARESARESAGESVGEAVAGGVAPVRPDLAQSIQFWMRAYPRRWRARRGEELFGVLADLNRPDARHLGARDAIDLLRGGWATRWREHPPLRTWLLYRLFDRTIPVAYRAWALDDIDGYWFALRRNGLVSAWLVPFVFLPAFTWSRVIFAVCFVSLELLVTVVKPERYRRQARVKHVAARAGELVFAGALVAGNGPRRRATARSALACTVVSLGVVAAISAVSAAFAPDGLYSVPIPGETNAFEVVVRPLGSVRILVTSVLAVALVIGLFGAALARRRLRRLLGRRVEQPVRFLLPVSLLPKVAITVATAAVAAFAWLELSGQVALSLSVVFGVLALLLLPGAVVGLIEARRSGATDLAGSDVWCIAAHGRVPGADTPVPDLWVLSGQIPDGVVVPPRPLGDPSYPALP
jgi:hypothetical protein